MPRTADISDDPAVSVSIPVELGGYTGQRDQWEQHASDYKVEVDDEGLVVLSAHGYGGRRIRFRKDALDRAVKYIEEGYRP